MEHYLLDGVADGVFAAIATSGGGGRGNAAIVQLDGGTLVFDTGMTPQAGNELRSLAERSGPVRWVVNSHWHADHVRGNQAFTGAEIVATARTKGLIETRAAEQLAERQATDFAELLASLPDDPGSPEDLTYRGWVTATPTAGSRTSARSRRSMSTGSCPGTVPLPRSPTCGAP